jgi:hypothetical protein
MHNQPETRRIPPALTMARVTAILMFLLLMATVAVAIAASMHPATAAGTGAFTYHG